MAEATGKRTGRKAIRIINSIVDFMVLTVILVLVFVALYAIWDSDQVYKAAEAAQYSVYKPGTTEEGDLSFEELKAVNPEVFSWLTVYGTNIDYPVTQTNDNAKYVNTNAFGEYSLSGAIFLHYLNNKDFQDFNSILFGHHMEKKAMFGELGSFSSKSFFDSHRYGNLYYNSKNHGLEFFAFIKTNAYDGGVFAPGVQGKEAQQAYLTALLDKALYTREIGVTSDHRILLLTTCASDETNGRDILAARIVDECYSDTFKEKPDHSSPSVSVDRQEGIWGSLPRWIKIMLPALLIILLAAAIYSKFRKKVKEGKCHESKK